MRSCSAASAASRSTGIVAIDEDRRHGAHRRRAHGSERGCSSGGSEVVTCHGFGSRPTRMLFTEL
jgi:hypothetical protein